ncbi:MAG: hypothetical protein RLZZ206_1722 [Cyanobacteriota bacterium]|jgi:hypothetical protein
MFRWFSPFALPQQVLEQLSASGGCIWSPEEGAPEAETATSLLVIYPPPHAALGPTALLLAGYQKLHALKAKGHLLHLERLLAHPVETWNRLFSPESPPLPPSFSLEKPAPLQALITLALLRERPTLLDAYLDLELSSDLGGSPPDSEYALRLRESSSVEALLDALHDEAEQYETRQQQDQLAAQQEKSLLAELESRAQQLEDANNRLTVETVRTLHVQQALEASDRMVLDLRRQLQELDQAHVAQQQELEDLHTELEQLFYSERQKIQSLDRLEQEAQVLRKGLGECEERRRADHIKLEQIQNDYVAQEALVVSQKDQLRVSHIRLEESLQSLLDKEIELERLRILQAETDFQGKREQKLMVERQVDLEKELGTLRGSLQRDSANLEQVREDNQHLLGALHETEEELEHYFLQTQHGRQLMDAQQLQLQRAAALLQRMAALKGITTGVPISPPIQVMALLEGYRHSLKRAERFLGREVFSGEASRISE